jgi:hypothetical protein
MDDQSQMHMKTVEGSNKTMDHAQYSALREVIKELYKEISDKADQS